MSSPNSESSSQPHLESDSGDGVQPAQIVRPAHERIVLVGWAALREPALRTGVDHHGTAAEMVARLAAVAHRVSVARAV